jgi:hypothetical protein
MYIYMCIFIYTHTHIYIYKYIGWGDQLWTKMFFFLCTVYRLSCLIEASFRPEKYWFVCAGLLADHLFS